jgi:hypothetical protein
MRLSFFALLPLALALPAAASAQETSADDVRVNQLVVYGTDPCPPSTDEEITVCARLPEDERFRIPPALRDDPNDVRNESWVTKAQALEMVGRSGIGSCTPVGPGGATGCFNQLVQQAQAERANSDEVNWTVLVEEARRERLQRIDAQSEAVEQELRQAGE